MIILCVSVAEFLLYKIVFVSWKSVNFWNSVNILICYLLGYTFVIQNVRNFMIVQRNPINLIEKRVSES